MYTTPQNGQTTASTVAPTLHLGTYRRAIMSAMSADEFTEAERLRANHAVHECQDAAKLALWLQNVTRLQAEREAKALAGFAQAIERGEELVQQVAAQPAPWATATQCDEIYRLACLPCFTAGEKTATLRGLVTLTEAGAVREIGSLYATAWRRGALPLHWEDGSTRLAA